MKRAFFLTLLLIGVVAAIISLRRHASRVQKAAATSPVSPIPGVADDAGLSPSATRVVALTRMLPRYALEVAADDVTKTREALLRLLAQRGGRVAGALPSDVRAPLAAEVPRAELKSFLREAKRIAPELRLRADGERPDANGRSFYEVSIWVRPR
jgi:hypothetical protein